VRRAFRFKTHFFFISNSKQTKKKNIYTREKKTFIHDRQQHLQWSAQSEREKKQSDTHRDVVSKEDGQSQSLLLN
jgi:hypothetical protein